MTDPLGQSETYSYTALGLPSTKTDRNGNETSYTLDAAGRTVEESVTSSRGDVITVSTSYAPNGGVVRKSEHQEGEAVNELVNSYDSMGRLKSAAYTRGDYSDRSEYTYDKGGNRATYKLTQNGTTILSEEYGYTNFELF